MSSRAIESNVHGAGLYYFRPFRSLCNHRELVEAAESAWGSGLGIRDSGFGIRGSGFGIREP